MTELLASAIKKEAQKFQEYYHWLENHMPASFFEEVTQDALFLIVHSLIGFDVQNYFTPLYLKGSAIALCLDSPDADLRVLKHFRLRGMKNYRAFVSNEPPPFPGIKTPLRIAFITFTEYTAKKPPIDEIIPEDKQKEILQLVRERNADITESELARLLEKMGPRFLRSLTKERLVIAIDMYLRAKTRDHCQYEIRYNEDWKEKKDTPSVQIVFAWKNVAKHNFLYRLAKVIYRHGLVMRRVNGTFIDPYTKQSTMVMSLGIHGAKGGAAWEETDMTDFLQELVTLKFFEGMELVETTFVDSGLLSGNLGNLIKTIVYFVHQTLVHADINMYSFSHVEEALCRHPELTVLLTEAFTFKFHPEKNNKEQYRQIRDSFLKMVSELDTGSEFNDTRRKNILKQAMHFVDFTLKTNFYRNNKIAFSFRLDPSYLDLVPYERKEKFPEVPYAVFFMKGMYFLGFHIRFKDLSRGGLRTVLPQKMEQMVVERNNVFSEAYNLAYTQQKKNKDIPEGGAKGIIFLEPYERIALQEEIYKRELEEAEAPAAEIEEMIKSYHDEMKLEYLYAAQRAYIDSFMTLINCEPDGTLKASHIVDYWKRPEYIYLGPDENMHNEMIIWISNYSKQKGYKPGGSFISSKPGAGINHKEYGVTSLGVNVYMEEVLKFLGIDPTKDTFTIKISGGPDGDVAGNQILNLYKFYPKTAKLLALTDVSGTIYDPKGLHLEVLAKLFAEVKPIRFYPPDLLSDGGFLLDMRTKREQTAYAQQTLLWKKEGGKLKEEWLSGNDMNHLFRHNVHRTKTDVFIPGGGRPRTLNESNYKDFTDETGKPTSRAIVEGANLYLTPWARRALEKLGTLIIKDSSANKGGVICSSFEILSGLCLSEEEFIKEKPILMPEILHIIRMRAKDEARLLLNTYRDSKEFLTDISEHVSEKINTFKYGLLDYLQGQTLSNDPDDPLIRCLLNYCPPLLRTKYQKRILLELPDIHKKAVIACYIAQRLVYSRGLDWSPSLVDVLPLIARDPSVIQVIE